MTASNPDATRVPVGELYGMVQLQALVVSMKEIYGWLLMVALVALLVILVSYAPLRPWAIFPNGRPYAALSAVWSGLMPATRNP